MKIQKMLKKKVWWVPVRDERNRKIWLNGNILPVDEAKINVLAPTAQFGANVFEGIRAYWNEDLKQLFAFRLDAHYDRLFNSIKMFRMDCQFTRPQMQQGLVDVIRSNDYREDIAIRQTVFLDGFGSWSATGPVGMFIAPIAKPRSIPNKTALRCCISSWERISERNLSPRVKVGANYINSRMAQMEAIQNGYDSALLMNHAGKMAEGPGSCLFIVRDGTLITPPGTASVLESITRDTILALAQEELKIPVVIRDIDRTELYICDEAFLCGSAMEIAPISEVDGLPIQDKQARGLVSSLHSLYLDVTSGKIESYRHWLTPIY